MKQFPDNQWLFLTLLLAALVLTGCAAQRYARRGDVALSTGRPIAAVEYYEQVLEVNPKKAQDPEFMAKLKSARRDAAMVHGRRHAAAGRWDEALTAFKRVLAIDPRYTPAHDAIEQVRQDAAEEYYNQALAQADHGHLSDADSAVRTALEYLPTHEQAHNAAESLAGEGEASSPANVAYRSGEKFLQEKRYEKAQAQFKTVKRTAPYHLPARAGLHEATQQLRASRELTGKGKELLTRGRLDDAIAKLDQALQVWPYNEKAATFMDTTRDRRAEAEALVADASPSFATWAISRCAATTGFRVALQNRRIFHRY